MGIAIALDDQATSVGLDADLAAADKGRKFGVACVDVVDAEFDEGDAAILRAV